MHGEAIRASWTFSHKKTTVKDIPIICHEDPRGCGCKGAHTYVYTATALGKCRVASPTPGRLYPRYSYYNRLSGLQEQSGYEGVKKISTPPAPGPVAKRLAVWATWPLKKTMTWIQSTLSHLKETYNYIYCNVTVGPIRTCSYTVVTSAKLRYLPPSLCQKKKKELPLWVQKPSSIFGLKAVTSPLAFGPVRFTTLLPPPLFAIQKIVSVLYGLQAGVSSACRGEDNIPLLQTQRPLVSKFI